MLYISVRITYIGYTSSQYYLYMHYIALGGLCAAASAAVIELLPFVHTVELQALLAMVFPSGAAMFAAAASVSKARCEVLQQHYYSYIVRLCKLLVFMCSCEYV